MNIVLSGNFEWSDEDLSLLSSSGKNTIIRLENEEESLSVHEALVDVVICNWFFKYHPLQKFTNLQFVQLLSVGYNGIDYEMARDMGIALYNARDVYSIPISEFVIGRLLSFYKHDSYFSENQKKRKWIKNRTLEELHGKKVLIIGTGSIGTEIAKRIGAFTDEVFGCNRTVRTTHLFKEVFHLSALQCIISDFDIVVLSIALTDATDHLINKEMLSHMKSSAIIVNVSRGAIIDEAALISALEVGTIGGAILDVFEEEPLSLQSRLWDMENVLISPHNSFVSNNNNARLREVIFRNFREWEKKYGEPTE